MGGCQRWKKSSVGELSLPAGLGFGPGNGTSVSSMQLEVLLFAAARDAAGSDTIRVEVAEPARAADVIDAIGRQLPQLAGLASVLSLGGRL